MLCPSPLNRDIPTAIIIQIDLPSPQYCDISTAIRIPRAVLFPLYRDIPTTIIIQNAILLSLVLLEETEILDLRVYRDRMDLGDHKESRARIRPRYPWTTRTTRTSWGTTGVQRSGSGSPSGTGTNKGPDPLSGDEPPRLFGNDVTEEERRALLQKAYQQLKASFERFKKPDGSKNAPAKTCRDLSVAYPTLANGEYWLDPNEGDIKDAILVYCDMENKLTCLLPQPAASPQISHVGREQELWLSEIKPRFKINYKADSNQIAFLQLLSSSASQNFTYHCRNSVGYFDLQHKTYRRGLKLLG
ncbi:Collagen alpha-2(V) chain [Homalodisca vitripennis]|nr:Collagen alpha-2(V) chain [Homalodisca vitripennis]